MKNITIVTYNSSEKVKTESVNLDSYDHPKIQATPQANYELIDTTNGSAPQHIITKRSGNDLEILFDEEASETLTIEGFYDSPNSNLIGLGEDGSYYYYVPDTVSAINSTAQVNAIDQSLVSQSLSGSSLNEPWWVTSTVTSEGVNIVPWMLGAVTGLGFVHLVSKNDDKDKAVLKDLDTTVNKPVVSIDDITGDNILNDAELAQSTITITGKLSNLDADVDASKTSVTLTVNNKTVTATVTGNTFSADVASNDLKADSKVTATAMVTDNSNNTATSEAATKAYTLNLDTTVNKPVVSIDDITGDNILNDAELAQSTITITGKLSNLDADIDASKTSVTLTVNNKSITATVTGNTFSADVASNDLKADSKVTATAMVTDNSNNTATSEAATKAYTLSLDTTVNKPVVSIDDITGDNVLSDAELAQATITITGKLSNLDADIDASKTSVTLTVNNKTVTATVTGNTFSADVNSSDLKADSKVTATAMVTDNSNNTATSEAATKAYTLSLDTTVNKPVVSIDDITGDNVLSDAELAQSTITITGKLSNLDADIDASKTSVTLTVNNKTVTATVTGNTFSADVNSSDLKADSKVTATAMVTDDSNNTATSEAATKTYSFPVQPITIDNITNDNHINNSEAQEDLVISGKADSLYQGQKIEVLIGNNTYDALVQSDGTFSTTVSALNLIPIDNYKIFAQLEGDTASKVSHTYSISEYVAANIEIDAIENKTPVNGMDNQLIRLSGFLDVTNTDYAKGYNISLVKAINIQIGDTVYNAGINEETQNFYIDVKLSDINKANGTPISYTFETSNKIFEIATDLNFGNAYDKVIEVIHAPTLDENNTEITFSPTSIIQTNGSIHQVDSSSVTDLLTTNITGTASGTAKAGDNVAVEVSGITYQTTLKADKSFSIDITTNDLTNIDASNVKATLTTKDLADNIITVSNETNYLTTPVNDGSMVSWTGKLSDYQDLPYFIQVLDVETYISTNNTNYALGYLANHYHGNESGSHTINYYFATAAEGSVYSTSRGELLNPISYTQTNKAAVNEALEILERYIDVDFNLVSNMSDADISYFMADINGGNLNNNVAYTAGYASYGGNVHLSAEAYGDSYSSLGSLNSFDGFSTIAHETMHTMGAKHPFEEGVGSTKLSPDIDSTGLSLMSYNDDNDFHDLYDIRIYDLAYLQYRFGVNPDQRAGDDIYTFKTFNQGSVDGDIYIWDGSGTDIFDASQEQQGVYVNLTPGSNIYSSIDNMNQEFFAVQGVLVDSALSYFPTEIDANENYIIVEKKDDSSNSYKVYNEIETVYDFTEGHSFIGYGTQIENLNGSEFDDILIGNKADNVIYGGKGNDTINGGAGDDYIDGGNGFDSMDGGKGNDIFVINNINDTIVELVDGGIDSVFASVDYKLDSDIESLVLIGNAIKGIGNELDNVIEGNNLDNNLSGGIGSDTLIGGSGNNILTGGNGSDIFLFDAILDGSISIITYFNSGDNDIIQLDSTIFDSLNLSGSSSISQYMNYDDTTGVLSYDSDGSSITDPIHFVTISQGLTFEESWFSVV